MTTNAQQLYDYLTSQGLSPAGAAGVVGNAMDESSVNPTITNGIGAYGIAQWLGGRLTALRSYGQANGGRSDTVYVQERFLADEMKTQYPSLWQSLATSTDPRAAALAVMQQYERPGDGSGPAREAFAVQAFQNAGAIPGAASNNTGTLLQAGPGAIAGAVGNTVSNAASSVVNGAVSAAAAGARPLVLEGLVALLGLGLIALGANNLTRGYLRGLRGAVGAAA